MHEVIHINKFQTEQDGWLTPVFPGGAIDGGVLNVTMGYQGKVYGFSAVYPGVGSNCVTFSIPSGNLTRIDVINGIGSYCYQG
jgi:hypothetical protein